MSAWLECPELATSQLVTSTAHADARAAAAASAIDSVPKVATVTVLGHINHGKTSLLDTITNKRVAASEAGGITQQLRSHCLKHKGNKINLLDTPGHSLFESIRLNTMCVTDAAMLVVAANEGVSCQTRECAGYVASRGLPALVVYTKLDLGMTALQRARAELVKLGIALESEGGWVPEVCVSARSKENVQLLLDVLCSVLEAEKAECDVGARPQGVVLDVSASEGCETRACVLVTAGVLTPGRALASARALKLANGVRFAMASTLTFVTGVVEHVKPGQLLTTQRGETALPARASQVAIVIKADSLSSIQGLNALMTARRVSIAHASVGPLTDANVALASAVGSLAVAFNTKVSAEARKAAIKLGVTLVEADVVYAVADAIEAALCAKQRERATARATVVKGSGVRDSAILGAKMTRGELRARQRVEVWRGDANVGSLTVCGLNRLGAPVSTVRRGQEFELCVDASASAPAVIKPGDELKANTARG
ncbi:putative translation initiation factor IF-2, C terminal fragment [Candidatus Hodgkinia cicadicola Dsem]|nr:putative translation initiation factor IF-2, C terminal fragment [Candidatus Hodgkinia cicadicola Dsem]